MIYETDLLNAYRDQLAKIRAAFGALEFEECYAVAGYDELEKCINSTQADELENLYNIKGPSLILPDGSGFHTDSNGHHLIIPPYKTGGKSDA